MKQKFKHFMCTYYRKNGTNFYRIINLKNGLWTSIWWDGDENPDKTAKIQLINDYTYEKKHKEMEKIYKQTNDYGLAWKILKKSEIYEKIENEKSLLFANI